MSRVSGTEALCQLQCKALLLAGLKGCLDNGLELRWKSVDFPRRQKDIFGKAKAVASSHKVFDGCSESFGKFEGIVNAREDIFGHPATDGVDTDPGLDGDPFLGCPQLPEVVVKVDPKIQGHKQFIGGLVNIYTDLKKIS